MAKVYKVKDSGDRQVFSTGAHRDIQEGKGRFDLLPDYALFLIAKHYEAGAKKYSANQWKKGMPLSRYYDSAMRHMTKGKLGMKDEPHFVAACWNLMCLIETKFMIDTGILPKELDDMSKLPKHMEMIDLFSVDPCDIKAEQAFEEHCKEKIIIDLDVNKDLKERIDKLCENNPEFKTIFDKLMGERK